EAPSFGVRSARERASRSRQIRANVRKLDVEAEAKVVARGRDLPERVVGFGARLVKLEICGPHLVRDRATRPRGEEKGADESSPHHCAAATFVSSAGSTLTV